MLAPTGADRRRFPGAVLARGAAQSRSPGTLDPVNRRPKLSIVAPNASPAEAAAVIAAVERFMRETAPVRAVAPVRANAWRAAALREGVERQPFEPLPWG